MQGNKFLDKIKPKTIRKYKFSPTLHTNTPILSPIDFKYFNSKPHNNDNHDNKFPETDSIPLNKSNSNTNISDSKIMASNAFEIKSESIHPMDEPIVLRNGKKLYPEKSKNKSVNDDNILKIDEIFKLIEIIFKFLISSIINFWNLNWYFSIIISDNHKKIHVPTLIFSLISIVLLLFIKNNDSNNNQPFITTTSKKSSNGNFGLFPFFIILSIGIYYLYNSNNKDTNHQDNKLNNINSDTVNNNQNNNKEDDLADDEKSEISTVVELFDGKSNFTNCSDTFSNNSSDSLESLKCNNFEKKLLTNVNKNKICVPKEYPRRNNFKINNNDYNKKLNIKLSSNSKNINTHNHSNNHTHKNIGYNGGLPTPTFSSNEYDFDQMTEMARNHMLNRH